MLALTWVAAAGAQTFLQHAEQFRVGPNVTSIVAADLNGDGMPEIVTCERGKMVDLREERPANDQLSYLIAGEDLKYTAQPQLRSGFAPYCVAVANIDGLKAPDLVVGNFLATRDRDITLLRNISNDFFEPTHFTVPDEDLRYTKMRDGDDKAIFTTPGITSLIVHDIDKDGYRDVVATGWSSNVLLFFPGAEEGYFSAPVITQAPGGPRDVKAADLDGDGNLDLVTTLYSSNEIALWKGDGTGAFEEVGRFASRGNLPHKVVLTDFNGDKRVDIAVSHCHADDSVVVFYGDGGFRFSSSQEILLGKERGAIEYEIRDMVAGDFNRDGLTDIAVACYAANQVVVLINESRGGGDLGSFRREVYDYDEGKPRALCVSDFNGDGKPDLGVALWESNSVALLLGK